MGVSSVYKDIVASVMYLGKSFTYRVKIKRPNTDPCGTLQVTSVCEETHLPGNL